MMNLENVPNASTNSSVIDLAVQIANLYREGRSQRAPKPTATTDELRQRLNIELSEHGRVATDVINDLANAAQGGLVGNTGPDFYGWVMGASSDVGVAADILTSAWGQNAAIYQTAPAAAIAEEVAASWLLELLDLPRSSSVGFTTGATMASYIGLSAARTEMLHRIDWDVEENGLFNAPNIPIIVSDEAHASVLAVLRYLGFGSRYIQAVETDSQGRMKVAAVERAMKTSSRPGIIIAQAGHINTGAFDPIDAIANLAIDRGFWLHIDGAFGLWARCSDIVRQQTLGIEKADSWAIDGHKWLQVPYDSGYAIVKDSAAHKRAMSIDASYLNQDENDGRNPSQFGPELSRRARGFTTWAILQSLGRRGIVEMVDRHCHCAKQIAEQLSRIPGISVLNEVCLNQVVVAFDESYAAAREGVHSADLVIAEMQKENLSFVSGADWAGQRIMRISVIAGETTDTNTNQLIASIESAWSRVKQ